MKWLRYITISLLAFGFGVVFAYLMQGHPTFETFMNFIAGGFSLGLVIEAVGMLREWLKERKEEKLKRREILEGYLEEHSRDLVNEVLKRWFEKPESAFSMIVGENCYDTPLAKACYEPRFQSTVEKPSEPHNLKYVDQAIQHLHAKEYSDAWAIWIECKRLVKEHLEKIVKMWESIEEKLISNIPAKFTEWNAKGTSPPDCYILGNTVWEIYREAEYFKATGRFEETSFKKEKEKDYFRVGMATLYAKSPDESLIEEFKKIVCGFVTDQSLLEQLKLLDVEKKVIDDLVEKFSQTLDKIVDDFEKGHINLKGTCQRCKLWYDELVSLR
jgi:hypothetical protein